MWFIDLPLGLNKADAALYASPFAHIANTPDEDGDLVQALRAALGERAGRDGGNLIGRVRKCARALKR
jgi:hypothetical protein